MEGTLFRIISNILHLPRNPAHHDRLTFLGVCDYLRLPDEQLLAWTEEDSTSSKKAMELGASIAESRCFYLDTQHKYKEQYTV